MISRLLERMRKDDCLHVHVMHRTIASAIHQELIIPLSRIFISQLWFEFSLTPIVSIPLCLRFFIMSSCVPFPNSFFHPTQYSQMLQQSFIGIQYIRLGASLTVVSVMTFPKLITLHSILPTLGHISLKLIPNC